MIEVYRRRISLLLAAISVVSLVFAVGFYKEADASGYNENYTVRASASKTTALANNADTVDVKVFFFRYVCNYQSYEGGPRNVKWADPKSCDAAGGVYGEEGIDHTDGTCTNGGEAHVTSTGEGSIISPTKLCADANGYASFIVKSDAVGDKKITVTAHVRNYPGPTAYAISTLDLKFVTPTPVASPQHPSPSVPEMDSTQLDEKTITEAELPKTETHEVQRVSGIAYYWWLIMGLALIGLIAAAVLRYKHDNRLRRIVSKFIKRKA